MTSFLALWAPVCISVECLIPLGKYFFIIFDYIGFESLPLPPMNPTSSSGHSTSEWLLDRFWLGRGIETRLFDLSYFFLIYIRAGSISLRMSLYVFEIASSRLALGVRPFFVTGLPPAAPLTQHVKREQGSRPQMTSEC